MISLIAAIGKNNELGKNNDLVWRLPADQKFFRETTKGHTVITGRKNFEAMGRALPHRRNIVVTRDKTYRAEGAEVAHSLEEALALAGASSDKEEVFIIGGAEIYKQAMGFANRLYITHIEAEDKDADTFFPEIIPIVWNEIKHEEYTRDEKNPLDYTFSVYERFF